MTLKSDANGWGALARFFHWMTVILILVQGTIGLVMVELPKRPNVIPVFNFHKSLGLTILAFAILRVVWRVFDRRPEQPPSMPRWQVHGAALGHVLLYALIFAMPLSGWLFDSATALRPLHWFGLFRVPSLTGKNPDLADIAVQVHHWLFFTLIVVAAGHAAVALWHQFVTRDGILERMWSGRPLQTAPTKSP